MSGFHPASTNIGFTFYIFWQAYKRLPFASRHYFVILWLHKSERAHFSVVFQGFFPFRTIWGFSSSLSVFFSIFLVTLSEGCYCYFLLFYQLSGVIAYAPKVTIFLFPGKKSLNSLWIAGFFSFSELMILRAKHGFQGLFCLALSGSFLVLHLGFIIYFSKTSLEGYSFIWLCQGVIPVPLVSFSTLPFFH